MKNYVVTLLIRYLIFWPLHFSPDSSVATFKIIIWAVAILNSFGFMELLCSLSFLSMGPCNSPLLIWLIHANLSQLHLHTSYKKHFLISVLVWISLFSVFTFALYIPSQMLSHFTMFVQIFVLPFRVLLLEIQTSQLIYYYIPRMCCIYCYVDVTENIHK